MSIEIDRTMTKREFKLEHRSIRMGCRINYFRRERNPERNRELWDQFYDRSPRWFWECRPKSGTPQRSLDLAYGRRDCWARIQCNLCYVPHSWPHKAKNP